MSLTIDFCGEIYSPSEDEPFYIGREGDIALDDNPFLHRRFLRIQSRNPMWSLANVGSRLSATVADADGYSQSWLAPGAEIPFVFEHTAIRFAAGKTSYEIDCTLTDPIFSGGQTERGGTGSTTRGGINFTESQLLLVLVLAEPVLRSGKSISSIPATADAAKRLGWTQTRFNRKLDNVCERLTAAGVRGLRGTPGKLASSRRARLVEYALAMRLVSVDDLHLLDAARASARATAATALRGSDGA